MIPKPGIQTQGSRRRKPSAGIQSHHTRLRTPSPAIQPHRTRLRNLDAGIQIQELTPTCRNPNAEPRHRNPNPKKLFPRIQPNRRSPHPGIHIMESKHKFPSQESKPMTQTEFPKDTILGLLLTAMRELQALTPICH